MQVIDLISLKPFDMEAITNSVTKTKRVIVVEECMKTGGIGASLSATINESLFDQLDHQVHPFLPIKSKGCHIVHGLNLHRVVDSLLAFLVADKMKDRYTHRSIDQQIP